MMKQLSIGKLRGLQQCTSKTGTFTALALDHRQNLRRALNPQDPQAVSDEQISQFKLQVTKVLAGEATAVLLDPQYSAAQALAEGIIPAEVGLVSALESTGYTGEANARRGQVLPGWSVAKAKRMGASMVKLLVYYHPQSEASGEIEAFVTEIAAQCEHYDLGLMLEPLSYSLDPKQKLSSAAKRAVVVETAARLTLPGVDLLKAEFPLDASSSNESEWISACSEISSVSRSPWILLSAAVDFDLFLRQATVACRYGASGIAVGRAVWQEAVQMPAEKRFSFLDNVARQRIIKLNYLCQALARPITDFYTAGALGFDWYQNYPGF